MSTSRRWGMVVALGTLWLVWGSTYLAVSWVLPAVPPFILSAFRFATAAPILAIGALAAGIERPTMRQVGGAMVVGTFLFVGGNGGTVFSQTHLASGITAILVGLVPLWLVVLGAVVERERPHPWRVAGVLVGLVGVIGLSGGAGSARLDPIGVASAVTGTLCWATGSILARRLELPASIAWSTATQMAAGSVGLFVLGTATGQLGQVHLDRIDGRAIACFAWLVVGGSIAALLAYNWLLRVTSPAIATTYAYVNPLVAVWLGWTLGGERLTGPQLGWSTAVVAAVMLVTSAPKRSAPDVQLAPGKAGT